MEKSDFIMCTICGHEDDSKEDMIEHLQDHEDEGQDMVDEASDQINLILNDK